MNSKTISQKSKRGTVDNASTKVNYKLLSSREKKSEVFQLLKLFDMLY